MIKRILVGLGDAKCVAAEVQHAVELARVHAAELTAITLVDAKAINPPIEVAGATGTARLRTYGASGWARELAHERWEDLRAQTESSLKQLADICEEAGVIYRTEVIHGDPFEFIVSRSRYFDLFICGLNRVFDYSILDETSDALVRLVANGVRPILTVPEHFRPIRRIMVAYSGSVDSAKTMKKFIQSQLFPVPSLRIVTIDQPPAESRVLLADAVAYCRAHGYKPETDILAEHRAHNLLGLAEEWGADLIVLGNSDRGILSRLFFRDTSLDIIRDADRALFLAQ
jgi:nucleotide-binding universal stress UspA family protein